MDTLTLFIVEIADRSLLSELRGIYEETMSYSESHRYFVRSYPTFPQQLLKKSQTTKRLPTVSAMRWDHFHDRPS